jgi:hypothetical protein
MKLNTLRHRLDFAGMGLWAPEALRSRSAIAGCHSNEAVILGVTAAPHTVPFLSIADIQFLDDKKFVY